MERRYGLNIGHEENKDDFGLPKVLTEDPLKDLQYLYVLVSLFLSVERCC